MTELQQQIEDFGRRARAAARALARATSAQKNRGLQAMADAVEGSSRAILEANGEDVARRKKTASPRPCSIA
jgi:glutamate-5-semialdehyde dehydrogenase